MTRHLDEINMTSLVAELQERLRRFVSGPPGDPAPADPSGPAGRVALAARLLAVVAADRLGDDAADLAAALTALADALGAAPTPLPGSAWESDLTGLADLLEDLVAAWDAHDGQAVAGAWDRVAASGGRIFRGEAVADRVSADVPAAEEAAAPPVAPSPTESEDPRTASVWLLVAGSLRRASLRDRLRRAGFEVTCPDDPADALRRLEHGRPAALICDDAAPSRFWSRLRAGLPEAAPPLVLVRARAGAETRIDAAHAVWRPPYDAADLPGVLRG
jgi:hypothetical protein